MDRNLPISITATDNDIEARTDTQTETEIRRGDAKTRQEAENAAGRGSLDLQVSADYAVHETYTVDTTDREDHTFCGIMFDVEAKKQVSVYITFLCYS